MSHEQHGPTDAVDSPLEALAAGVTKQWLFGKRILALTGRSPTREAVDAWIAAFKIELAACPPERPFLVLIDFSSREAGMSPYSRQRGQDLINEVNAMHRDGAVALITPRSIVGQAVQMFFRLQRRSTMPTQVFFHREDGLKWLKERLRLFEARPGFHRPH